MVWDGACGFCAYWTTRWSKMTNNMVEYKPYQEVARNFKDIDEQHFKEASRLIETSGEIFSGPRSAYRTFTYTNSFWQFLDKWYAHKPWFASLSDKAYNLVAQNRSACFKVTKLLFGSNPKEPKPFWFIYVSILAYLIYVNY